MTYKLTTKQDVYARVRRHLIRQKKPAIGKFGTCVYRDKDGNKCAIGCLIPKRLYKESLEYSSLGSETGIDNALRKSGVKLTKPIRKLLHMLQAYHDVIGHTTTESPSADPFGVKSDRDEFCKTHPFSAMPKSEREFSKWISSYITKEMYNFEERNFI